MASDQVLNQAFARQRHACGRWFNLSKFVNEGALALPFRERELVANLPHYGQFEKTAFRGIKILFNHFSGYDKGFVTYDGRSRKETDTNYFAKAAVRFGAEPYPVGYVVMGSKTELPRPSKIPTLLVP